MIAVPVGQRVSRWGEGPVWHHDRLFHVDIEGHAIVAHDPDGAPETIWNLGRRVGFVVPRRNGGFIAGGDDGIFFFDPISGATEPIAHPEADKPDNRFNDGKCSPDGRLFAGTISLAKTKGDARLYRLDADLSLATAYGPVTNSNGLAWSSDGKTLHYIDTPTRAVLAFDYETETGDLLNPRVAFSTEGLCDASPDGMAADAEGMLWIAFCHGGCVLRIDPRTGRAIARIDVPALETTSVAFGGPGLRHLYITTGIHSKIQEPFAGRLFLVENLPAPGLPVSAFAG